MFNLLVIRMERTKKISLIALICIILSMSIATVATAAEDNADEAFEMAIFGGTICLIGSIVWLIIFILIAIWVYKDAEKRGKSGVLWLIIVILLGLIGLIIWLIVRPKTVAPK